jgi:hypothetical protein
MKKSLFTTMVICMALMVFQLQANAGSTVAVSSEDEAIVNFDESEIYASFDQVNDLVSYVSENDAVSYADVASFNNALVENVSSSAALALSNTGGGEPPFISAFLWGCIFWGFGVLVVALTTDMDMNYIKKAAYGCAVSTGVYVICWLIYYFALRATVYY